MTKTFKVGDRVKLTNGWKKETADNDYLISLSGGRNRYTVKGINESGEINVLQDGGAPEHMRVYNFEPERLELL